MAKEEKKSLFTGLDITSFTEDDVRLLTDLFSVLANDKRLDILKTTIADQVTRLKDLAKELGEKNSAQIALHAKKLYEAGLLKKEGLSLRDSREYVPTIAEETYIFLRIALKYAQIVNSRRTELELAQLKANAEAASERLAESPILAGTISFSDIAPQYEDSLNLARETFNDLVAQFAKLINIKEL
ncbi:MAG: hypothetical protein ACFFCD_04335 [Promethearchaeota archaeon]